MGRDHVGVTLLHKPERLRKEGIVFIEYSLFQVIEFIRDTYISRFHAN